MMFNTLLPVYCPPCDRSSITITSLNLAPFPTIASITFRTINSYTIMKHIHPFNMQFIPASSFILLSSLQRLQQGKNDLSSFLPQSYS